MNKPNLLTDRPGDTAAYAPAEAELARPLWGHSVVTPEGLELRLPKYAILALKKLGLVNPLHSLNAWQISPRIDAFLDPDCDSLMGGLRRLLGKELEGPEWLICKCQECERIKAESDKTPAPRRPEEAKRGRYWLKVIRAPRHITSADQN